MTELEIRRKAKAMLAIERKKAADEIRRSRANIRYMNGLQAFIDEWFEAFNKMLEPGARARSAKLLKSVQRLEAQRLSGCS